MIKIYFLNALHLLSGTIPKCSSLKIKLTSNGNRNNNEVRIDFK